MNAVIITSQCLWIPVVYTGATATERQPLHGNTVVTMETSHLHHNTTVMQPYATVAATRDMSEDNIIQGQCRRSDVKTDASLRASPLPICNCAECAMTSHLFIASLHCHDDTVTTTLSRRHRHDGVISVTSRASAVQWARRRRRRCQRGAASVASVAGVVVPPTCRTRGGSPSGPSPSSVRRRSSTCRARTCSS